MPAVWTKVVLMLPVVVMSVQDFRSRRISVIALVVFAIGAIAYEWLSVGVEAMLVNTGINLGLLALMFGGVALWLLVSKKGDRKSVKKQIGAGDVLFMAALAPLFQLREFVYFLLTAMVMALGWWVVMNAVKRDRTLTIPLVGMMGSVCTLWIIVSVLL